MRAGSATALWRSAGFRASLLQVLVAVALLGAGAFLVGNALDALSRLGVATGFGFLVQPAGFGIGESPIPYTASDTYGRAYLVGLLNTLRVSAAGIVLAVTVGVAVGFARLSRNLFVAGFATLYVDLFRNTPQLLQIVFWYAVATHLPRPREAIRPLPDLYLANRGLFLPWPVGGEAWWMVALALVAGIAAALLVRRHLARRPGRGVALLLLALAPAALAAAVGLTLDRPVLRGLNLRGGMQLSPEFLALLLGLGLYIAAFIAEIVRAGILSVPRGQHDAAWALGLPRGATSRLVVLPQALRLMIPPATGQFVSLVKNSSLAVAIGYPDLVNIGNTTINQSGQVVEGIVMVMAVYLTISLLIAAAMNTYNRLVMARLGRS